MIRVNSRAKLLEAVLKVMKCVVWTEKTVAQGTSQTVPRPRDCRAIPLGWNAAPGSFLSKPFGQSCFGSWSALGTRTRAYGPGHLAPALPSGPNQSLRHASALLRQPLNLLKRWGSFLEIFVSFCSKLNFSVSPIILLL